MVDKMTEILYETDILIQNIDYYILENNYNIFLNEKTGINIKKVIIEKIKDLIKILKDIWEKVKYFFSEYIPKKWKALKDKINNKKEKNETPIEQTIKTYDLKEIFKYYSLLVDLFDFIGNEKTFDSDVTENLDKKIEIGEEKYKEFEDKGMQKEYKIVDLNNIISKIYAESPNLNNLSKSIKEKEKQIEEDIKTLAEMKEKQEISEDKIRKFEDYTTFIAKNLKMQIKYQTKCLNLIKKYNDLLYTEIERVLKPKEFEFVSFENKELEKAINSKDKMWLKAALLNAIWNDPGLKHGEVNRLISIIKSKFPDFFEEEKTQLGEHREADKNKWDMNYFTDLTYWFRENPALSRLSYIFKVGKEISK